MKFLSLDDQKTVCRRECQLAFQKQDALQRQLSQTRMRYQRVLEAQEAIRKLGDSLDDEPSRYLERMELLERLSSRLANEQSVSLPRLTAMEQAKGFAMSSYASTALAASKLKEGTSPALEVQKMALRRAFKALLCNICI